MCKKHFIIILLSLILTAPGLWADLYFGLPGSYPSSSGGEDWDTSNPATNPYCAKIDENGKAILRDVALPGIFKAVVFGSNGTDGANVEDWYTNNYTEKLNSTIKLLEETTLHKENRKYYNMSLTDGEKPGNWDEIHSGQTFNVEFERIYDNGEYTHKLTIYPTIYI